MQVSRSYECLRPEQPFRREPRAPRHLTSLSCSMVSRRPNPPIIRHPFRCSRKGRSSRRVPRSSRSLTSFIHGPPLARSTGLVNARRGNDVPAENLDLQVAHLPDRRILVPHISRSSECLRLEQPFRRESRSSRDLPPFRTQHVHQTDTALALRGQRSPGRAQPCFEMLARGTTFCARSSISTRLTSLYLWPSRPTQAIFVTLAAGTIFSTRTSTFTRHHLPHRGRMEPAPRTRPFRR